MYVLVCACLYDVMPLDAVCVRYGVMMCVVLCGMCVLLFNVFVCFVRAVLCDVVWPVRL